MNNNINIENYMIFWIDYLDGNLNISDEGKLFDFLEEYPGIASELIDSEAYKIPKFHVEFPGKEKLYGENQIENHIISKIENTIDEEDDRFITELIKNDADVEKTYNLYQKTILTPDKAVAYPFKDKLYKTDSRKVFGITTYLVAASIILVAIAGFFIMNNIGISGMVETPVITEDVRILQNEENNITEPYGYEKTNADEQISASDVKIEIEKMSYNDASVTASVNEVKINSGSQPEILEKIPVMEVVAIDNENEDITLDYRNDKDNVNEEMLYAYTIEYIRTPEIEEDVKVEKDEKIGFRKRVKNTLKRVVRFGVDFDIKDTYEKIKDWRDDELITHGNDKK